MQLGIRKGDGDAETVEVAGERFVLGRDPSADLTLDDGEASREHAAIRVDADGKVTIEDLGSLNGTYVNGQKIAAPTALNGGEEIRIGTTVLDATVPAAEAATQPGAPVPTTPGSPQPPEPPPPPAEQPPAAAPPPSGPAAAAPPPGGQPAQSPAYQAAGANGGRTAPASRRGLLIGLAAGGALLVIGIIVAIVASSGGDDKKTSASVTTPAVSQTTPPATQPPADTGPTETEFQTQANATCSNFESELASNLKVIKSSSATSSDKRKAVGSFGRLLQTQAKQLGTIQAPESDAATFDKLIRSFDTGGGEFNDSANAFEAGNNSEGRSKLQTAASEIKRGSGLAKELGLTSCD